MRAFVSTPGGPVPAEIRDVPEPALGAGEALVEVRAFGVNRGELTLLANRTDWRPGQDIAGVVVQPAEDGSGPQAGARVVALVDQAGWSQRVAARTSRLAQLPDSVSFEAGAALPVAGLTALRALRVGGALLGRSVLVTGASGGVGLFAVQLASRAGARVAGVVGNPEKEALVRRLGASEVVPRIEDAHGPFYLVLESVGGLSLTGALRQAARDGTVVVFGSSSREPSTISFSDFAGRAHATIYGFFVYESGEPPTFGEDLGYLASLVAEGELDPGLGWQGPWTDLPAALAALRDRQVAGKVVLTVD